MGRAHQDRGAERGQGNWDTEWNSSRMRMILVDPPLCSRSRRSMWLSLSIKSFRWIAWEMRWSASSTIQTLKSKEFTTMRHPTPPPSSSGCSVIGPPTIRLLRGPDALHALSLSSFSCAMQCGEQRGPIRQAAAGFLFGVWVSKACWRGSYPALEGN